MVVVLVLVVIIVQPCSPSGGNDGSGVGDGCCVLEWFLLYSVVTLAEVMEVIVAQVVIIVQPCSPSGGDDGGGGYGVGPRVGFVSYLLWSAWRVSGRRDSVEGLTGAAKATNEPLTLEGSCHYD